jgi:DNA-binding CsgD family transcriptional regulator
MKRDKEGSQKAKKKPPLTNVALRLINANELPSLLTKREIRVMALVAEGWTLQEIGEDEEIDLTISGTATITRQVRNKIHAESTAHAVAKLVRVGLI